MPLRDFECRSCHERQERFFWNTTGVPACEGCGGELELLPLANSIPGKTGVFPYTCPHVDGSGKPITIESIGHLRQVEKQYGVVFSAFSQNPNNPDHIRDLPKHRVGGREYER